MPSKLPSTPLERAIEEIRADLKPKECAKNEFYKQLLTQQQPDSTQPERENEGNQLLQSQVSAEKLRQFMEELQVRVQRRRDYRVVSRLGPFVDSLQMLMKSCETLFQSTPFGVNIAFSGARILLQMSESVMNYFDTVLEAMEQIGKILACYEKFAAAYSDTQVQRCLVSSYKRILLFWGKAWQTLDSKLRMPLKSITKSLDREIKEALDSIEKDTRDVQRIAQAVEAELTQNDRAQKRRAAILDWIMGREQVDTERPLKSQLKRRYAGTCTWIFEDARFSAWLSGKKSSAVWYNAPAGSGKSVLSSAVVDHLVGMGKHVAYTFYSFSDPWHRYTLSGLRSLALQLMIILEKSGQAIPDKVAAIYEGAVRQHILTLDSLDTAVQLVYELVKLCPEVYLVIDGLDECAEEDQMLFMLISLLRAPTLGCCKWFFTSRSDYPKIRTIMQQSAAISIVPSQEAISRDIQRYFSATVAASSSLKCQECIADWVKDCDVSFLYATVIADILSGKDFTCQEEIDEALRGFPQELHQYYMVLLERLATQPASKQELARRVFLILTSSAQSISLDELLNALAVRPDAPDHSDSRTPSRKLVEELCMPFVTFDVNGNSSREQGAEKSPIVKLYHKTVKDFFLQGLDSLDVRPELRKFFVTPKSAAMELGMTCITYLRYKRYAQSLDIKALLGSDSKEHAFLPYAATFWPYHLTETDPTAEADKHVKDFLKSPNFWTCLGVLTHTAKYQFARFNSDNSRRYSMAIRHSGSRSNTEYEPMAGLPLPSWLGTFSNEGRALDQSFFSFVEEWREVLTTDPDGLSSCLPLVKLPETCCLLPPSEKRPVKAVFLEDASGYKLDGICEARLADIYLSKKTLWAEVLYREQDDKAQLTWSLAPLFSTKKKKTPAPTKHAIPKETEGLVISRTNSCSPKSSTSRETPSDRISLGAWAVDPQTLDVKYTGEESSERYNAPRSLLQGVVRVSEGEWVVLSTDVMPAAGKSQRLLVFQMQWLPKKKLGERDTRIRAEDVSPDEDETKADSSEDENSESDESDDDSDSDSDSNSDAEDREEQSTSNDSQDSSEKETSDEDEDDPETEWTSDNDGDIDRCLIIVPQDGPIHWHTWSNTFASKTALRHRLSCAVHPTLPILAVTHTPSQVELLDLETWTWRTAHLPELSDLQSSPAGSIRELRFSPCGTYLHSMFIGFTSTSSSSPSSTAITARLTSSTFTFHPSGTPDSTLVRSSPARSASYTFDACEGLISTNPSGVNQPPPLALTYWTDDAVIVALPPLTCRPKIIRLDLTDHDNDNVVMTLDRKAAVYFPTSTPRRQPRLLYKRSTTTPTDGENKKEDCLYLALDTDKCNTTFHLDSSPTDRANKEEKYCTQTRTQVVLRWKIDKDKWRPWEPSKDGESDEIQRSEDVWSALRGTFVESGKSFAVLTRSGLDWTRRGYLSCG